MDDQNRSEKTKKSLHEKSNVSSLQKSIDQQVRAGKKLNPLKDIFGKWPGDETDEEFEQMLKELD